MKIYEIQDSTDKFWYASNTAIQALLLHLSIWDSDLTDLNHSDDIVEIPACKWKEFNITDFYKKDKNGNYKVIETFFDYMKRESNSDIISLTLY